MSSLRIFDVIVTLVVACYTSRSREARATGRHCILAYHSMKELVCYVSYLQQPKTTPKQTLSPCCPDCNVEYDVGFRVNFERCFLLAVLHLLIHQNPIRHDTETTTTVRHVRWQSRTTPPNMTYSQLRSHSPPFYNPLREVRHHERCRLRRLGRFIRGLRRRHRRRGEVSDLEILHAVF